MRQIVLALLITTATVATLSASGSNLPLPDRARAADYVVVGTVVNVVAAWEQLPVGRIIVSHALVRVDAALKGQPGQVMPLDVEGGTIGELTLNVSDMETIARGDRAVFFVRHSNAGANVPNQRGNGIVKLDAANRVKGSGLTLAEIKRQVKQGVQ
jgi:hypothetical protein